MNSCEILKHHLVKYDRASTEQHERLSKHVDECESCRRLLKSWGLIPALLEALPEHEPGEILQRRTRNVISQHADSDRPVVPPAPRMAASLATAAVLLAAVGISRQLMDSEFPPVSPPAYKEEYEPVAGPAPQSRPRSRQLDNFKTGTELSEVRSAEQQRADKDGRVDGVFARSELDTTDQMAPSGSRSGSLAAELPEEEALRLAARRSASSRNYEETSGAGQDLARSNESQADDYVQRASNVDHAGTPVNIAGAIEKQQRIAERPDTDPDLEAGTKPKALKSESGDMLGQVFGNTETSDQGSLDESIPRDPISTNFRVAEGELARGKSSEDKKNRPAAAPPAEGFEAQPHGAFKDGLTYFQQDQNIGQLHFQPAEGYWANTHVPGDPAIRLLKARLAQWDRGGSQLLAGLEQEVRPVHQPFDAPADNALALSLMSDANAVDGDTRMRLQVGIRGIEHRRGQRPAMNMGLVIDLPADADDDTRIATRALLDAVLASKQPGDSFSLVLNSSEDLVVAPDEFRFGPLQLARQVIAGSNQDSSDQHYNLAQAISKATAMVRQTDDPSLPLGSSSIMLISADVLGNIEQLTTQVHAQAVEGITLSVVPLGPRPENHNVEQLVLAGLGHRRVLEAPDQARKLVETELHASSRAVARAARLSIRLAPGVRLVEVLGSERLDEQRSQRVRDIENSMDSRLSRNFGIEADRGDDEGGIQIVIPSIFSGDDVTVLLDVVASQPGEIASVSLRYKDLVYLRNGKLSGQLSLPAGALEHGPEQHAVIKSLMAHHFSIAVGRAADALGRQQPREAATILAAMRDQIIGLRERVPAFRNDPDLQRDLQILERYIHVLATSGAHQPELADSLRYAAWAKAHRPPAEWK